MANCALEEYVLFLQELMNGPGGPVGIRDSAGGQNTNEDKDNQGQEPRFPSLHPKAEEHCPEAEC